MVGAWAVDVIKIGIRATLPFGADVPTRMSGFSKGVHCNIPHQPMEMGVM